jgi:hypothetical protein
MDPTEAMAGAAPPTIPPAAVIVDEAAPMAAPVIADETRDAASGAAAVLAEIVANVRCGFPDRRL